MNYSPIDDYSEEHIKVLIKWLFEEVCSAGGDGDGIWYSRYYKAEDIKNLIIDEKLHPVHFEITKEKEGEFVFGEGQEWLTITNDEQSFYTRPSWQQVSLSY